MGADYSSYSIIGLKVDPDKLYTEAIRKTYNHNHPENMKFDPETGKKLWETRQEPISQFNESEEEFSGYPVVFGTDRGEAFICIYCASGTYSNGGSNSSFTKIDEDFNLIKEKKEMKNLLEPLGLWNEKDFGLWTVLHCSY